MEYHITPPSFNFEDLTLWFILNPLLICTCMYQNVISRYSCMKNSMPMTRATMYNMMNLCTCTVHDAIFNCTGLTLLPHSEPIVSFVHVSSTPYSINKISHRCSLTYVCSIALTPHSVHTHRKNHHTSRLNRLN